RQTRSWRGPPALAPRRARAAGPGRTVDVGSPRVRRLEIQLKSHRTAAGESRSARAPKEQPPRNLSGPHTAATRQLWKADTRLTDSEIRATARESSQVT